MGTGVTKSNTTDVVNSNPTPTASNGSDALHHNTVTQAPTATTPPTPASPVTPTAPKSSSTATIPSPVVASGASTPTPPSTQTPTTPPTGWDAKTYANFKAANPGLEPDAQDTAMMLGAKSPTDTAIAAEDAAQAQLDKANADFQSKADAVSKTILDIQHGAIPLNAGEQAQVNALSQQYGQLIQSQQLQNTSAANGAYIRGYQTGSAEYDPTFAVKTIGAIVTAGSQAVADLNTKMAGAVADLTQSFHNNDIAAVKDAYTVYEDAYTKRADTLQKTIDNAQAQIKAAQDAQQKIQDNIDAITKEAAQNGAPTDVLSKLNSATSQAEAIGIAAQYMTDPTSTGGQYAAYVRQAQAAGQTPISAGAFIAKQKYNESYSSAAGTAAGKASGTGTSGSTTDLTSLTPTAQATLKSNGFTSFSSNVQDLAIQLVSGQLAPSELSKRTTGTSSYSDVLTAANKYSQATSGKSFDIAQADRNYKFALNPQTQNTLNYLGSLVGSDNGSGTFVGGNLNQLIAQSNERASKFDASKWGHGFAPSNLPALNNVQQWAALETGDPSMAAYHATLMETADQVAKILQGGGAGGGTSDAKLAQAQSLFDTGFTPDQMAAVATSLQGLLSNRASSMIKDNPYLSDYATQFGVQTNNGISTTNQQIMQDETAATGKISAFYNTSPKNAAIVDALHQQFPDLSASEVAQNLGL